MPPKRKDEGDNKTEVIVVGDDNGRTGKSKTPETEVVNAGTPGPITSRQSRNKPRTVEDVVHPHTPSNVHRYRKAGSPGNSVGQVRGIFVPWSREADYGRGELPTQFPLQRLAPVSPNQTNATRTMTRDLDLYDPPEYFHSRNPMRDHYPYDGPKDHYPYDLPSGHYPYFSFPPDELKYRRRRHLPPRDKVVPKGKWSVVSNAGSRKQKPPARKAVSDPGKFETALWVNRHGEPTRPDYWPYRIEHDPVINRDFLESPLGKRRYIGHVPKVTDRDRWERQYWDYLMQMDVDSEVLDQRRRHRGYYKSDPAILETSHWLRQNYGVLPDHTDHHNWWDREKEIHRQRERERYFGMKKRDHLLTRGSLLAMEGSELGPDWYMTENERLRYLHHQDIARRKAYVDRVRHRDNDSHFTSVSQRGEKMERLRRGWWTPLNVRDDESRYTEYKPNWQVNDNWRYKKPRANPKHKNVALWLKDQR